MRNTTESLYKPQIEEEGLQKTLILAREIAKEILKKRHRLSSQQEAALPEQMKSESKGKYPVPRKSEVRQLNNLAWA